MSEETGEPMQLALEQAWESFRNGSFPLVPCLWIMADQSLMFDMAATRKMEIVDRLDFVQAVDLATKGGAVAIGHVGS
jgi:hypothetical protein